MIAEVCEGVGGVDERVGARRLAMRVAEFVRGGREVVWRASEGECDWHKRGTFFLVR